MKLSLTTTITTTKADWEVGRWFSPPLSPRTTFLKKVHLCSGTVEDFSGASRAAVVPFGGLGRKVAEERRNHNCICRSNLLFLNHLLE